MDPKIVRSITEQIHRRFPEFAGCKPKVRLQTASGGALPKGGSSTYLLTFQSSARSSSNGPGKTIPRWVRVVVTEGGRILKITTSR